MMQEIFTYLETNLGLDQETAKIILEEYVGMMTDYMAKLDAALAATDFDQIRVISHTMKGSSANIGAEIVRAAAYDLEKVGHNHDTAGLPTAVEGVKKAFAEFQVAFATC